MTTTHDTAPVAFPVAAPTEGSAAGDAIAERLRGASQALETRSNLDRRERAIANLLRAVSLRTATTFVIANHDGTVRTCCDTHAPCDAHTYCLALADAILG